MKVAVVGSRSFRNEFVMAENLDKIHQIKPITLIISGGAVGADTYAAEWAKYRNIPTLIFKPDWKKYGKRAGFIRNTDIVTNADTVVAFWDGESRGTKNSMDKAKQLNKPLLVVRF